jgi:hypothetical protein
VKAKSTLPIAAKETKPIVAAIPAGRPPSSLSGRGGGGGTDRDEPGGFACFVSVAAPHMRVNPSLRP